MVDSHKPEPRQFSDRSDVGINQGRVESPAPSRASRAPSQSAQHSRRPSVSGSHHQSEMNSMHGSRSHAPAGKSHTASRRTENPASRAPLSSYRGNEAPSAHGSRRPSVSGTHHQSELNSMQGSRSRAPSQRTEYPKTRAPSAPFRGTVRASAGGSVQASGSILQRVTRHLAQTVLNPEPSRSQSRTPSRSGSTRSLSASVSRTGAIVPLGPMGMINSPLSPSGIASDSPRRREAIFREGGSDGNGGQIFREVRVREAHVPRRSGLRRERGMSSSDSDSEPSRSTRLSRRHREIEILITPSRSRTTQRRPVSSDSDWSDNPSTCVPSRSRRTATSSLSTMVSSRSRRTTTSSASTVVPSSRRTATTTRGHDCRSAQCCRSVR